MYYDFSETANRMGSNMEAEYVSRTQEECSEMIAPPSVFYARTAARAVAHAMLRIAREEGVTGQAFEHLRWVAMKYAPVSHAYHDNWIDGVKG